MLSQLGAVEVVGAGGQRPGGRRRRRALRPGSGIPGRPDARARPGSKWRAGCIQNDDSPTIIFVTAFDQHAIEAFEVNAVDYLLKPVDAARLEQALERARRGLSATAPGSGALERPARADRAAHVRAARASASGWP